MRDGYWQDMKEEAEINPCPMVGILSDRAKTFHGLSKGSSFSGLHFLKITFKPGPKNRCENDSQRCNTGGRLCRYECEVHLICFTKQSGILSRLDSFAALVFLLRHISFWLEFFT